MAAVAKYILQAYYSPFIMVFKDIDFKPDLRCIIYCSLTDKENAFCFTLIELGIFVCSFVQ